MSIAASVSVGNATATVRKSPHNFSSIGQLKYGCRVSLEDSAKVSRYGKGGFFFIPLSTMQCYIPQ